MAAVDLYSYCEKYRKQNNIKGAENLENLSLKVAGIHWTEIDPVKTQKEIQKDHQGRVVPQYGNKYTFTKSQSARKAESVIIHRGMVKGIYNSLVLPCQGALKTKFGEISIDPGRQSFFHEDKIRVDHTFVYSGGDSGWTCTYSNDTLRYCFECTVHCSGEVIYMTKDGADQHSIAEIVGTVEPHSNLLQGNFLSWQMSGEYSYSDVDEPIPI